MWFADCVLAFIMGLGVYMLNRRYKDRVSIGFQCAGIIIMWLSLMLLGWKLGGVIYEHVF